MSVGSAARRKGKRLLGERVTYPDDLRDRSNSRTRDHIKAAIFGFVGREHRFTGNVSLLPVGWVLGHLVYIVEHGFILFY